MITVIMVLFPMIKAITTLVLMIWNENKNLINTTSGQALQ